MFAMKLVFKKEELEKLTNKGHELVIIAFEEAWPRWQKRVDRHIQQNVKKGGLIGRRTGLLAKAARAKDWEFRRLGNDYLLTLNLIGVPYGYHQEAGTQQFNAASKAPSIVSARTDGWLVAPMKPGRMPVTGVPNKLAQRVLASKYNQGMLKRGESVVVRNNMISLSKDGRLTPLWYLMKKVDLKPKYWFSTSVGQAKEGLPDDIAKVFDKAYEKFKAL